MKKTFSLILNIIIFLLAQRSWAAGVPALDIQALSEGPPQYSSAALSPASYLPVETHRLARPKLVWINIKLLQELGIHIPPEGLTAEFTAEILKAFAWAKPQKDDPADAFLPETKTFYADGYGGSGMNGNAGSGRAAGAGRIQIKGIGVTPMVYNPDDFGHSHGGASLEEAIREAIWGEVLTHELPYGANRVLAIIETGTKTNTINPLEKKRALIVRVDPLRPAHFMSNQSVKDERAVWDQKRLREALARLPYQLPQPKGVVPASPAQAIENGVLEFANRVAQQYAAAFSKSLYHGTSSPSNIGLNGELLDFGTMTSQPGFARIRVLTDVPPFGDTDTLKNDLLNEFIEDLRIQLPPDLRDAVPSNERVGAHFDQAYSRSLEEKILRLIGAPDEFVLDLLGTEVSQLLFKDLMDIVQAGNSKNIRVFLFTSRDHSKYNLAKILKSASRSLGGTRDPLMLAQALAPVLGDPKAALRFSTHYLSYLTRLEALARVQSISIDGLYTYMKEAARIRNEKPKFLYHEILTAKNMFKMFLQGTLGWNIIGQHIDETIQKSIKEFSGNGAYQLVLSESLPNASGVQTREIFDAKMNQYRTLTTGSVQAAPSVLVMSCASIFAE